MAVTLVLGGQWGDEGKGKLVDLLADHTDYVCRCQGGNNAGHTVIVDGISYDFHLLPSGIINTSCISVMGNGMVINLRSLFEEIEKNVQKGLSGWEERLKISSRAHIVFDFHCEVDRLMEEELGESGIGTTKKGIGPTYAAKCHRSGIRIGDIFAERDVLKKRLEVLINGYKARFRTFDVDINKELDIIEEYRKKIEPLVCDTVDLLHSAIKEGKTVLVEGANAVMLDIDFGTYPFVTSSNCSAGVVCTGLGIPPKDIGPVYGVFKAYTTRVGSGPFPTEQNNEDGEKLQRIGKEFGVTTGRRRRCGWFDAMIAHYSTMINGYTSVALTKIDILDTFEKIQIGIGYTYNGKKLDSVPVEQTVFENLEVQYMEMAGWNTPTAGITKFSDLPPNAQSYVMKIQELIGVHIEWVGTGPSRDDIIHIPRPTNP